jgi:hypothetical protein
MGYQRGQNDLRREFRNAVDESPIYWYRTDMRAIIDFTGCAINLMPGCGGKQIDMGCQAWEQSWEEVAKKIDARLRADNFIPMSEGPVWDKKDGHS